MKKKEIHILFGEILRDERLKQGKTQREMEDSVGMVAERIGKLENGKNKGRIDTYQKYANALGLEIILKKK